MQTQTKENHSSHTNLSVVKTTTGYKTHTDTSWTHVFSNIGPRTKLVQKKSSHVQQPTTSEPVYLVNHLLYQTCESSPVRRACHTNNPYWSSAIVVCFSCNKCHPRKMYNYTLQTLQIEIAQAIRSNHFIVGPIQRLKQICSQDKVSK